MQRGQFVAVFLSDSQCVHAILHAPLADQKFLFQTQKRAGMRVADDHLYVWFAERAIRLLTNGHASDARDGAFLLDASESWLQEAQ